jgi:septal ring-binding cell division protein DamX
MEITVKIQADELAGAINNLAEALLVDNNNLAESINNLALSVGPIEAVKTEPKRIVEGSQKVEDKPKPTEPPKAEPKEEPKAEKDEPQYKIEDIRTAFATFAKAKGKDKAKEILAQFNAHKVTELKEDDYNAVMKVLEE